MRLLPSALPTTTFPGNPNGTATQILGSGNLFWGANINYNLTIRYDAVAFPRRCTSCPDLGNPLMFTLLPQIAITPPTAPAVCASKA